MNNNIIEVDNLGLSPASVNRRTGDIFINTNLFYQYPKPIQDYILFHEKGHYDLQTTNELLADNYASNLLLGSQNLSLKSSVNALQGILPDNNLSKLRIELQYLRALAYDYVVYGNSKSKINYLRLKNK